MPRLPKRVLWILDYFPRPHDMTAGVWALESASTLKQKGVDVVVLAPTPWIPRLFAFNPSLQNWSRVPAKIELNGIPVFYPKCPYYPSRFVAKNFYNDFPFFDGAWVSKWCEKTVAKILDQYPVDVVHANFIFPAGCIGREIKKKYGLPLVVHERSLTRLTEARDHGNRRRIYAGVVRSADAAITVNSKMADIIRSIAFNGTPVDVIYDGGFRNNPVNVIFSAGLSVETVNHAAARPEIYQGQRVVLSVASFMERKGQEYLVRAVARVRKDMPDVRGILIGSGAQLDKVRNLIRTLHLEHFVEVRGQCAHADVLRVMSWCDVFAMPSWNEPGGTVYGEAMAFSKPIIACEGEGIGEHIENGVHGILVKPRDVDSLEAALRKILKDPQHTAEMGRQAGHLARKKFSYDAVATAIIKVYERVMS